MDDAEIIGALMCRYYELYKDPFEKMCALLAQASQSTIRNSVVVYENEGVCGFRTLEDAQLIVPHVREFHKTVPKDCYTAILYFKEKAPKKDVILMAGMKTPVLRDSTDASTQITGGDKDEASRYLHVYSNIHAFEFKMAIGLFECGGQSNKDKCVLYLPPTGNQEAMTIDRVKSEILVKDGMPEHSVQVIVDMLVAHADPKKRLPGYITVLICRNIEKMEYLYTLKKIDLIHPLLQQRTEEPAGSIPTDPPHPKTSSSNERKYYKRRLYGKTR